MSTLITHKAGEFRSSTEVVEAHVARSLLMALRDLLGQFKTIAPMSELNASCYLAEEFKAEYAIHKATQP